MKSARDVRTQRHWSTEELLRYRLKAVSRATIRRHYVLWRQQQGIAPHCDMEDCVFHTQPLKWRNNDLPLILDHINGNNLDNSPKNLRYLCPNCDSQLSTRGGRNRGRVAEAGDGTYVLLDSDGRRHRYIIVETGRLKLTGHPPTIIVSKDESK
jgi:hypothetical protein